MNSLLRELLSVSRQRQELREGLEPEISPDMIALYYGCSQNCHFRSLPFLAGPLCLLSLIVNSYLENTVNSSYSELLRDVQKLVVTQLVWNDNWFRP